jgi:hypothetical protein
MKKILLSIFKITAKIVALLVILNLTISCSSKQVDVKSPCVSTEDGPCGKKRSVNEWWMKNQSAS